MQRHDSLALPLQLASLPETQVSAGAGAMVHAPQAPAGLQVSVPAAQGPIKPSSEHERLSPLTQGQFSLAVPLQLSSFIAAHVSRAAGAMLHAPHVPFLPQVSVPAAHAPRRLSSAQDRVAWGLQEQPSLALPLQLSSLPSSHVSVPAGVTFPMTVTATPPGPIAVPDRPQPRPAAPEKSKAQILAETLSTSLNDLLSRYGSVPKARYKEDKPLVQRFQSQAGLGTDATYGPTTAEHVARYVADVPPPFYWKKGAGQRDLGIYRSNLETLALDAEQLGNTDRAERLRQSALKASLA